MEQKMYQQQKVSLKRKYANVSLKKKSGGDGCKLEEKARRCWCGSLWRFNTCTIIVLQD